MRGREEGLEMSSRRGGGAQRGRGAEGEGRRGGGAWEGGGLKGGDREERVERTERGDSVE